MRWLKSLPAGLGLLAVAAWLYATYEPTGPLPELLARLDSQHLGSREHAEAELRERRAELVPQLRALARRPDAPALRTRLRAYIPATWLRPHADLAAQARHALQILGVPVEEPVQLARPTHPAPTAPTAPETARARLIAELTRNATNETALPEIIAHAADPDAAVRRTVAVALGQNRVPTAEIVAELLKFLRDDNAEVRAAAAAALGSCRPVAREVTLALLEATTDPAAPVRLAALQAVLRFNDDRARAIVLRQLADDADPAVQTAIKAATNHAAPPREN